jgi:uncharacterized membrane protein
MNWLVIIAGFVGVFTTIGHFLIGSKEYLTPMLSASFDPVPKKVMHSVFHYVSAFLILSSLALLAMGFGFITDVRPSLLVRFIALNYAFFAIWQIALVATSKIPRGIVKIFQWVFFVIIALLAWLGA